MAYALRDLGRSEEAVSELLTLVSEHPTHTDALELLKSLGG